MPGAVIGKQFNPVPKVFWSGQITIQDKGKGVEYQIEREASADEKVARMIREELKRIVLDIRNG